MTICASEDIPALGSPHRAALTIAADGSYAARLARHADAAGSRFPERWTLSGPEPYAVPLPGHQPEEPDSELLPLADGRVLIRRRIAGHFAFSLLYPAGPGTGELPLGAVAAPELTLLPPAPGGLLGYALAPGPYSTTVWLVTGGTRGPEPVAEVPGRCTGGAWLDRCGRLLALDRELAGRTKTVAVDLERGGETSELLQITEESDDRLLLADPDSGLLIVRSDAPGYDRLGWGVLGSCRPMRFPECLRPAGAVLTPFAVQPGQALTPENCAVAFRIDAPGGTWLGVWRPAERQLRQLPAPDGWLAGAGLWTAEGALLLPYSTHTVPCGVAVPTLPPAPDAGAGRGGVPGGATGCAPGGNPGGIADCALGGIPGGAPWTGGRILVRSPGRDGSPAAGAARRLGDLGHLGRLDELPHLSRGPYGETAPASAYAGAAYAPSGPAEGPARQPRRAPAHPQMCRPVPLQQAPLATREAR
ncbi:hypothetical protein [Streptomyces celluloflavus]|uniref:hypothetical protein n=1 Tax=Streptomyces celluloflavus TaxID=58344 RepID=UPI003650FB59